MFQRGCPRRRVRAMLTEIAPVIWLVVSLSGVSQAADVSTASSLFNRGRTWEQFLGTVAVQRELWLRNVAMATAPEELTERLARVARGLRLVIVAEDSCTDSVN